MSADNSLSRQRSNLLLNAYPVARPPARMWLRLQGAAIRIETKKYNLIHWATKTLLVDLVSSETEGTFPPGPIIPAGAKLITIDCLTHWMMIILSMNCLYHSYIGLYAAVSLKQPRSAFRSCRGTGSSLIHRLPIIGATFFVIWTQYVKIFTVEIPRKLKRLQIFLNSTSEENHNSCNHSYIEAMVKSNDAICARTTVLGQVVTRYMIS